MADTIDGYVVWPGEEFSINEVVGPRTEAKGYKRDGAIINGEVVCCDEPANVGGGVSQYGTTIYNAIFFGCYEDLEHTPHSIYISRYPEGREATLGYPQPDVRFRNDTDAPVIIRNTYDGNSTITVKFYGNNGGRLCEAERSERSNYTDPKIVYEANPSLTPGTENVVSKGSQGWTVTVTRIMTMPDGTVIREPYTHRYRGSFRKIERHPCDIPGSGVACPVGVPGRQRPQRGRRRRNTQRRRIRRQRDLRRRHRRRPERSCHLEFAGRTSASGDHDHDHRRRLHAACGRRLLSRLSALQGTLPAAHDPPPKRIVKPRVVLFALLPIALFLLPAGVFWVDRSIADGEVPRNVSVEGIDISGLSYDDAMLTIQAYERQLQTAPAVFEVNDHSFQLDPASVGVQIDEEAAITEAMNQRTEGGSISRFFAWLGGFNETVDIRSAGHDGSRCDQRPARDLGGRGNRESRVRRGRVGGRRRGCC